MSQQTRSLEHTPSWVVAVVCSIIVFISLCAERGLHRLGKCFKDKKQKALYQALERLKEELMLLGFVSLLLTVLQWPISRICVPSHVASSMLPCKIGNSDHSKYSRLASSGQQLSSRDTIDSEDHTCKGKVPLLSIEALHELHVFIFVLALVHVVFCATTMVLGGLKIREWKQWEKPILNEMGAGEGKQRVEPILNEMEAGEAAPVHRRHHHHGYHYNIFKSRAGNYWRKAAVVGWMIAFFKQFYGSVTKSDYVALRHGFIKAHCPSNPDFNFHGYMLRTLEIDFRKIVGISAYLWVFLVVSLLLNINGWHTYFWLAFLPLFFLLLVGAKLEHIMTRLAKDLAERKTEGDHEAAPVKPSDEHFWLGRPGIALYFIHFILFENAFEMAFFFWIWSTYGFSSCIMDKVDYIIPRLIIGVIVQVLCSYSTLPLYALVTQMGSMFKQGMFDDYFQSLLTDWARGTRKERKNNNKKKSSEPKQNVLPPTQQPPTPVVDEENAITKRSCC